ncbi:NTP transferase domain-containing protein [Schaalia sp. 19OD2882]|uniref:bifunctional UDP-N-acetylglucosamine diphosphorylase/glucosamine-1-phosphate N-acetyltransferase GlmU n=1 Tax=Schaalia sp. 19OD2882 TaxID=2794089 RepID=UPI001C1ED528|nr:NTP transferase domain-containing protein [Schaalia sp. 19OD2882]QWW20063.1 NTP transferase domain-containing protein [Schaalia sp. 19OD2882]
MTRPAAVIVLAAGQGTRMKSALPKVVHPVAGLSMIGHALRAADALEPEHLVAVVRHERDTVVAEALRVVPRTFVADQDDVPGTGRAVLCALEALSAKVGPVGGTVVVTSGDVPMLSAGTLRALVETHEGAAHAVTVLTSITSDPTGYGRIVRDQDGQVIAIVEQKDATEAQRAITEVNAGVYAFDGEFLARTLAGVGTDNAQGEVYLTDVLAAAAPAGRTAGAVVLEDAWEAQGCNDRVQLAQLGAEFNRRICEKHMRAGVTIEDPSSTWIDVDVTIGADTVIRPATYLRGSTEIGARCEIGPGTTLDDVRVGDGAHLPAVWGAGAVVAGDTMGTPFSVLGESDRD